MSHLPAVSASGPAKEKLLEAMQGHVLAEGQLMGKYIGQQHS